MFRSAGNIDEAIDEVTRWADSLPGDFSIDVTDHDAEVLIELNGVLISSGLLLSASVLLAPDLTVLEYRFQLRHTDHGLLWRHDRHPGHENEPGMRGPEHVHQMRGGRAVRLPADPVDLVGMRDALVQANLDQAG